MEDVTGISGTGVVAEGVQFTDGVVVLQWLGKWPTSVVFHERGIESVAAIHGHDGRTVIDWADEADPPPVHRMVLACRTRKADRDICADSGEPIGPAGLCVPCREQIEWADANDRDA